MDSRPKPSLVILAAGMGSRYGGLKQIEPVGPSGELIIEYSIFDALRAGFGKIICVIRRDIRQDFERLLARAVKAGVRIEYAYQDLRDIPPGLSVLATRKKQWGTAHAVHACRSVVHEPFGVLNADDFYGLQSFRVLADFLSPLSVSEPSFSLVGFRLRNTLSEHGGVSRGVCSVSPEGLLTGVVERHGIEKVGEEGRFLDDGQTILLGGDTLISMNMWGFTPAFFPLVEAQLISFLQRQGNSERAEFYIPSAVDLLLREQTATVRCLCSDERWFGVTHPKDKDEVVQSIAQLVQRGAYPRSLWR